MTPHEIKLGLERKLLELGVSIVGVHSVSAEDDVVFAGYDLTAHPWLLFYEFKLPELVNRDDIRAFAAWLAEPGYCGETVH